MKSSEIRLKYRPVGLPRESDFELAQATLREPGEGDVLVHNIYLSVDPYMRGRMVDRESYTPPFQIGQPLTGGCVGQVVQSKNSTFQAGSYVLSMQGWREFFLSDGSDITEIDPDRAPIQAYLGIAGMPGLTAYVGLLDIGQPKKGDTVFVSAASGAVGSVACQIARIKGCRVVGSAGSDEKVAWLLTEAGIDAAFNYKQVNDLTAELGRLCPNGIDVYFENVGGEHLEAALSNMNDFGRIVVCGMISAYNATAPQPGPRNLGTVISKRLMLKGFIVTDHYDRLPEYHVDLASWIAEGKITWHETIIEGIENAPKAFIGLFTGQNFGKMLVKVGPDPTL
jgi:NADPH-dependent curcumin reductase CurA